MTSEEQLLDCCRHVFLVGFMGAGKSTIGPLLAKRLAREFLDLDSLIASSARKSIRQIFAEDGEEQFRRLERDAIASCEGRDYAVIALGGGAFASTENRELLRPLGTTVWLSCPLEVCLARVAGNRARPKLGSPREMQRLLAERTPAYSMADLVIDSGQQTPAAIAREIEQHLRLGLRCLNSSVQPLEI